MRLVGMAPTTPFCIVSRRLVGLFSLALRSAERNTMLLRAVSQRRRIHTKRNGGPLLGGYCAER